MRQSICVAIATLCLLSDACSQEVLRRENVDESPAEELVFENRFFVLAIDPTRGASAISLKAR